jgi:2-oxoglutarate ferredoxin oxidoreductase subunit gamma
VILAEAAAVYDGKNVVETQAYGPEARGGATKAELIVSTEPIDYPKVLMADLFLSMSQKSCDKFCFDVKSSGIIVVDSSKVERVYTTFAYKSPITELAVEATGKAVTANILALGVVVGLSSVVSRSGLERAVCNRVPPGTEELNLRALDAGFAEASRLRSVEAEAGGTFWSGLASETTRARRIG